MLCHINSLLVAAVGFGHVILATSHNAARIDSHSTFAATVIAVAIVFGEHLVEVRVVEVDQVVIC